MRKRMFESIDPHLTIAVRAMANRVALRKGIGYISIDNVEGEHVGDPNRMDKDCLISFDMSFVVYTTHKNLPKLSPDRSKINLHVEIAPYEGIDAYWRDSNLVLHKSINLVDTVRADSKLTTLESCILEAMYIVLEYGENKNWGDTHSVTYSYNNTRSESYSKRVKSKRVKVESSSNGSYTLSGYLTNLGKYNEGELVGKWINLPIDEDDFEEELEEIGVDDDGEYFWSDWDCDLPYVTGKLSEYISLDDANELAEKVEEVDDKDAFCAAVEMFGIDEALDNWKYMYNIGEEVRSLDYTIGQYYFNDVLGGDLDKKTLKNYFDYSAYGRDLRIDGNFIYYDGHVWEYVE